MLWSCCKDHPGVPDPTSVCAWSLAVPGALLQGSWGLLLRTLEASTPCPSSLLPTGMGRRTEERGRYLLTVSLEDVPDRAGFCSQHQGMGASLALPLLCVGDLMVPPPGWGSLAKVLKKGWWPFWPRSLRQPQEKEHFLPLHLSGCTPKTEQPAALSSQKAFAAGLGLGQSWAHAAVLGAGSRLFLSLGSAWEPWLGAGAGHCSPIRGWGRVPAHPRLCR